MCELIQELPLILKDFCFSLKLQTQSQLENIQIWCLFFKLYLYLHLIHIFKVKIYK
jgi:hypothetical protein